MKEKRREATRTFSYRGTKDGLPARVGRNDEIKSAKEEEEEEEESEDEVPSSTPTGAYETTSIKYSKDRHDSMTEVVRDGSNEAKGTGLDKGDGTSDVKVRGTSSDADSANEEEEEGQSLKEEEVADDDETTLSLKSQSES